MLKLVDKPDLGSGAVRRVGSSPTIRTAMPMLPLRSMGIVYNSNQVQFGFRLCPLWFVLIIDVDSGC